MTKKDYVISTLEQIKDIRNPAEKFLLLMKEWMFQSDDSINAFVIFLSKAIKEFIITIKDEKRKITMEILHKLEELENNENPDTLLNNI